MSAVGLKGELKAFEKEFKAAHGRAPTKADIKARPDIGAAYAPDRLIFKTNISLFCSCKV